MFPEIQPMWPHDECDLKNKENNGMCFLTFKRLKHVMQNVLVLFCCGRDGLNRALGSSDEPRIRSMLIPSLGAGLDCPAASSSPAAAAGFARWCSFSSPDLKVKDAPVNASLPRWTCRAPCCRRAALPSRAQLFPKHHRKHLSTNGVLRLNV